MPFGLVSLLNAYDLDFCQAAVGFQSRIREINGFENNAHVTLKNAYEQKMESKVVVVL